MYEPVSDRCVRTFIRTKFAEEDLEKCNELMPPEKPPRKNKMNKQTKQESNEAQHTKCNKSETKNNSTMKNNGETCIDVDHIHIETHNYKNKHTNASVQTSPLIPYRLRFWPGGSDVKCDPGTSGCCSKVRFVCCCRLLSQWVLSQVGLTVVVVLWALLGAFVFNRTEGPRELEQSLNLAQVQTNLSINLANELGALETPGLWKYTIDKYLQRHEGYLLEAVSAGFGEGGGGRIWTYPGCVLFAVSLLTTLGFGAPVPRTSLGRFSAVLFSALGIPLHFLLILNMGNLGAVRLQQLAFGSSDIPTSPRPLWLKWFPVASILVYYLTGVVLFGFVRRRCAIDSFMFPLDFTAAGGVATTDGHVRLLYALYLEFAVMLAALVLSLVQASATRGVVDVGLRLGLLTNT